MSRVFVVIVLALATAGCGGMVRLAYNNGDMAVRWAANDYFDLDDEQSTIARARIARFHAWHRGAELPRYASLATSAADRIERGLGAADVSWALGEVRARYRTLAEQAAGDAVPLLAKLGPQNLAALEKKFAASNAKLEREVLAGNERDRLQGRMDALRKRFEDWLGALTPEQEARLAAYARSAPNYSQTRFAERRARQAEFVRLLREHRDAPDLEARVKQYFVRYDQNRSADYPKLAREWDAALVALILDIDRSLTPEQRTRVVARLRRYAEDFRVLASVAASAPTAGGRGGQLLASQP